MSVCGGEGGGVGGLDLMSGENKTQKTKRECIMTGVILVCGCNI